MANENMVYLVENRLHIVTGTGAATRHYYYEEPTVLSKDEHTAAYGNMGFPVCTVGELTQALKRIQDARQ